MGEQQTKYKLEERTLLFSESVIDLCKGTSRSMVSDPIVRQLIRSATSIGANYAEANNASSRRDFRNKIFIAKKESQETLYWLRLMQKACGDSYDELLILQEECRELLLIFQKITTTLEKSKTNEN